MQRATIIQRIRIGLRQDPLRIIRRGLLAYGAIWSVFEPISSFFQKNWNPSQWAWWAMAGVSLVVGAWSVPSKSELRINLPNGGGRLTITTGDLLFFQGHKAIAVNEFFDSTLGSHVARSSLHGQAILQFFFGDPQRFDTAVSAVLPNNPLGIVTRNAGNSRQYAIGTTAVVDLGGWKLFLPALSRTDITTLKASANLSDLISMLQGLWSSARIHCGNEPIAIPLFGSGLSGVNLPPNALIEAIILSLWEASKVAPVTSEVIILLERGSFGKVNLGSLEHWNR